MAGRHISRTRVVAFAAALWAAITALRFLGGEDPGTPYTILYVLPIGLLGAAFGLKGGLLSAGVAVGSTAVWSSLAGVEIDFAGWLVRAITFAAVGAGFGVLSWLRVRDELRTARWFAMSNDMLAESDFNGFFTKVNEGWTDTLGYSEAEMLERPYFDLIHPEDQAPTVEVAAGLAEGNASVVQFENRYRAKDGSWHWLSWSCRSDEECIYAVARDVTERKALHEEREELLAKVEAMARTDELTGLPNRRAWNEELLREMSRAERYGTGLAVAMLDLDNFKAFNDEHGHPVGDELLREAGVEWRLTLRVSDFVARVGGEEFAVMLPGCPPVNASTILERLRAATPREQTCSAGVAEWDGKEEPDALMARADAALYEAKRRGRDQTVVAPG
jgi:diguanylate cyclase (GGDEF)-like protein/PAS domain S-box-containing protein